MSLCEQQGSGKETLMSESLQELVVDDGDLVRADHLRTALEAGTFVFDDGATQVFTPDGHTTYTEGGRPSTGDWWVLGDGEFVSFWPPSYRATYVVHWIVTDGAIAGLSFTEAKRGARFEGRYQ